MFLYMCTALLFPQACQFRIGRMVRLPPNEDSIILDSKLEELDDIVNW